MFEKSELILLSIFNHRENFLRPRNSFETFRMALRNARIKEVQRTFPRSFYEAAPVEVMFCDVGLGLLMSRVMCLVLTWCWVVSYTYRCVCWNLVELSYINCSEASINALKSSCVTQYLNSPSKHKRRLIVLVRVIALKGQKEEKKTKTWDSQPTQVVSSYLKPILVFTFASLTSVRQRKIGKPLCVISFLIDQTSREAQKI